MTKIDIRPATLADLPRLHPVVERAYRGDSARQGWTHEADLLSDTRTDLATLEHNLSPELYNTAQTRDEAYMDWAVNRDQDLRGAWSDLGRMWLTDKPRPLSPYPVMQTNGNP